jgi:hypothetical protein
MMNHKSEFLFYEGYLKANACLYVRWLLMMTILMADDDMAIERGCGATLRDPELT